MGWLDLLERLKSAMHLTDRQIAAMEKRRGWRVNRTVALKGLRNDGEKLDILAVNFGPGGMRIESAKRLKKDEELVLRVARPRADRCVSLEESEDDVRVKVRWCRNRKGLPSFESGVAFWGSEVQNRRAAARFLLEDCKLGLYNPREKRKAPRAHTDKMRVVFSTPDGAMTDGEVLDLAVGGALISSPRPVDRATDVLVKIFLDTRMPALDCKGTVMRCAPGGMPKTFELGVMFTQVPTDHSERLVSILAGLLKTASGA